MTPREHFEQLEIMSRERATLAKKEAEHWLAEAESGWRKRTSVEATQEIA
jgi:hypothetical protein